MASLYLRNGKIVDVENLTVNQGSILITNGIIERVNYSDDLIPTDAIIHDLQGKYITPGFIETHLHIESSMMPPLQFCNIAINHGTTSLFVDPHEIANVAGVPALLTWIDQAKKVPMDMYVAIPSCVPATHMEHSGATIGLTEIQNLISNEFVYGLGEMMNYPGIIYGIGDARAKVDLVYNYGKIVDGHCPGLIGEDLQIYVTNGHLDDKVRIMNDHESTDIEEVLEKLQIGMFIALRYGSATKDLDVILPKLIQLGVDLDHCTLCTDDLAPVELLKNGHMNRIIKRTAEIFLENGISSKEEAIIRAIRLATFTAGNYMEKFLKKTSRPLVGRIHPKFKANLLILNNLEEVSISSVIHNGKFIIQEGKNLAPPETYDYGNLLQSVNIQKEIMESDFLVNYDGENTQVPVNVIGITPVSLITEKRVFQLAVRQIDGQKFIDRDLSNDILKIAVFERHHDTGNQSVGFIQGLGIKNGALASTVAHDSHNLIVAGTNDADMVKLANFMREHGGGMAAIYNGNIVHFPLQIGGIMSSDPLETIVSNYNIVKEAAKQMGSPLDNVFMTLSFMALPVIPALKITDVGLIDVIKFEPINLIEQLPPKQESA
ncbi:MAG: adenine deaminase [Promethearchaeota archaeon]